MQNARWWDRLTKVRLLSWSSRDVNLGKSASMECGWKTKKRPPLRRLSAQPAKLRPLEQAPPVKVSKPPTFSTLTRIVPLSQSLVVGGNSTCRMSDTLYTIPRSGRIGAGSRICRCRSDRNSPRWCLTSMRSPNMCASFCKLINIWTGRMFLHPFWTRFLGVDMFKHQFTQVQLAPEFKTCHFGPFWQFGGPLSPKNPTKLRFWHFTSGMPN